MPGTTWEELWAHRLEGELLGVPTAFAGLDELIAMKATTAHPEKDLPDVERLREIRRRRDERP